MSDNNPSRTAAPHTPNRDPASSSPPSHLKDQVRPHPAKDAGQPSSERKD